jgi:ABC-type antimicrobial peptide transport system permease subunit
VEAGAALLLAGAGLHGIISYQVTRRTREIGVRMAMGATSRDISRMVLGQSLRTVRAGTLLGLAGALSLGRLLQILLQGISWFDPALFAGIALLLGSIALLAGYRPARHAASVDPQISLRAE